MEGAVRVKHCAAAVLLLTLLAGAVSGAEAAFIRQTTDYFGTVSLLCLYDEAEGPAVWEEVKTLLGEIEAAVSVSDPSSDVARFNALEAGESLPVSEITAEIVSVARRAWEETDGLYDPTVYPLVDLWGFSPRFNTNRAQDAMPYDRPLQDGQPVPAEDRFVKALFPLAGFGGVRLERRGGRPFLCKQTPSVVIENVRIPAQMDLGGIAKGYACDRVRALLEKRGCAEGYFVCGGSSMAFLARPDGSGYTVAAGNPRSLSAEPYAQLAAERTTLSTSSDESHSYRSGDILYCHIIDPGTGYPLNYPAEGEVQRGAASVTLLGESAAMGDALSTALCLMGPEAALRFLEGREEKMVMAVCRSGETLVEVVSNLPREAVELAAEDCTWACKEENGHILYSGEWAR